MRQVTHYLALLSLCVACQDQAPVEHSSKEAASQQKESKTEAHPKGSNSSGENTEDATPIHSPTPTPGTSEPSPIVGTVGPTSIDYEQAGPYAVVSVNDPALHDYQVYAPAYSTSGTTKHAVITWGNGTRAPTFVYDLLLRHLASHGFVVVASNSMYAGSGDEMVEGVRKVFAAASLPTSPLYNRIDTSGAGATGHSQGGKGALNAGNHSLIKCTAAIQPTRASLQLRGPALLMSGELDDIVSPMSIESQYQMINSPAVYAMKRGANHYSPIGAAPGFRGYITAWFKWHLLGELRAKEIFVGPSCQLCNDSGWKIDRKNL